MVGNRFLGDGNVLHSAGGSGGFCKIDGHTLPEYIMFSLLHLFYIWLKGFIVPDRNGLPEFIVTVDLVKPVLLSKFGGAAHFDQFFQDIILVLKGRSHSFSGTGIYIGSKWFC